MRLINHIKQIRHIKLLRMLAVVATALAIPPVVFFARSPVLIITDAPFAAIYGTSNLKQQRKSASLRLFRQVKPVPVADAASPDVVIFAIAEASSRPFCVLFDRSYSAAARQFHAQFPAVPAVVLSGFFPVSDLPPPDGILCAYRTDRETDLYRAGLFAGILGTAPLKAAPQTTAKQKNATPAEQAGPPEDPARRTYALWLDSLMPIGGQEAFTRGLREQDPESVAVFAFTIDEMPNIKETSCVVLTGAGAEYLENNPKMPIILFSWVDPGLTSREIAVQFDDSAWALAVPAVRMAAKKQAGGVIPSKPLISPSKIAHSGTLRLLKKSAKKVP